MIDRADWHVHAYYLERAWAYALASLILDK